MGGAHGEVQISVGRRGLHGELVSHINPRTARPWDKAWLGTSSGPPAPTPPVLHDSTIGSSLRRVWTLDGLASLHLADMDSISSLLLDPRCGPCQVRSVIIRYPSPSPEKIPPLNPLCHTRPIPIPNRWSPRTSRPCRRNTRTPYSSRSTSTRRTRYVRIPSP